LCLGNTVENLRRVCLQFHLEADVDLSSPAGLKSSTESLLRQVGRLEDAELRSSKREAIAEWKKKLQISSRKDKAAVHRWLKGGLVGPPKAFVESDGGLVCSPNKMLNMLTSHMEAIYNHHSDIDVGLKVREFHDRYGSSMQRLRAECELDLLDHNDLFNLFQKKSANKCGGLDGWAVAELHQLPPCGWVGFAFVMRLAEAIGEWPAAVRTICVSSIAKAELVRTPEDTRAIGISSVVYSVWSSLRFRQLSKWSKSVFPSNIVGGVQGRGVKGSMVYGLWLMV
jgi:hypothetical protein